MTKVSVIVPVYNKQERLRECLDSILAQSFRDFELICVNDGSTDGSAQVLEEYVASDDRVCVLTQPNQGVSMARNAGIEHAAGEYLCFIDADDTIDSDFISTLVNAAGAADIIECSPSGRAHRWIDSEIAEYADTVGRSLQGTAIWGKIYRAYMIKEGGLRFPPGVRFGEDTEFNLAVWAHAREIVDLPFDGYHYYNDGTRRYQLNKSEIENKIEALRRGYGALERRFGVKFDISRDINITLSLYPLERAFLNGVEYLKLFSRYTPGATITRLYGDGRCSPIIRSVVESKALATAGDTVAAREMLRKARRLYGSQFLKVNYPYRSVALLGHLVGLGLISVAIKLMTLR
ncbi:MAG: glycosyltransferase [Candidatus Amulumruptor caecigallinarius]|nr:glycosyltransferase [Candidatus Amulumruptor caecigallinarius]MCM1396290.1 glycosyltransferase [Candidatus Amulumruptor caecigallinarius]MCM1454284.1 glycosyltransferase [bacterium]